MARAKKLTSRYECPHALLDDRVGAGGNAASHDQVPAHERIRDVDHRRADSIRLGGELGQVSAQRSVQPFPTAAQFGGPLRDAHFVGAGQRHLRLGGEHHGAAETIAGVWARIGSMYDMHVDPHDYLQVDNERVVVLGRYWGPARDGGWAVDAAFAHIITTRGEKIASLRRITDTARWHIEPTS